MAKNYRITHSIEEDDAKLLEKVADDYKANGAYPFAGLSAGIDIAFSIGLEVLRKARSVDEGAQVVDATDVELRS